MTLRTARGRLYQARPPAGQKVREQRGAWETAANAQQRALVRVFDQWAAPLKAALLEAAFQGASIGRMQLMIDVALPDLEKALIDRTQKGVDKGIAVAVGRQEIPPAVRSRALAQMEADRVLVKDSLVPILRASLVGAVAVGATANVAALNTAFNAVRNRPAQYAGGLWVMIFETEKELGRENEKKRRSEGKPPQPVRWVLDPAAEHCFDSPGHHGCPSLAGEYPDGWDSLVTVPASLVTCRGNCRCTLEVFDGGRWRRGL